jgi:hypothetical protein
VTDYVFYSNNQGAPNGLPLGLYHYNGRDPNSLPGTTPPSNPDAPISYTLPDYTNGVDYVQFTFDVSQLVTDGSTGTQKAQEAAAIRFLQVNIVATDAVPTNQAYSGQKNTDAMGNTLNPNQQSGWLEIDLSQNRTYTSADTSSTLSPEPTGDVYGYPTPCGNCNDAIDINSWSIQVTNY